MLCKNYTLLRLQKLTLISESVIPGYHVTIGGLTFEQVSKRPFGKTLKRALVNEAKQERILIYG